MQVFLLARLVLLSNGPVLWAICTPSPRRGCRRAVKSYEVARASLARGGTEALRSYVQSLPDIQRALQGSVPASGLAAELYEDEQQNAREMRSRARIMRDA
jgi:hypothetical protein